jgi:hypothetical protein
MFAMRTFAALLLATTGCSSTVPAPDAEKSADLVLFDGKTLGSWKSVEFGGEGKVELVDGAIQADEGVALTGVVWTGAPLPKTNYELQLEAKKIDGSDFFCGIAFPVGAKFCSMVAGGWGGGLVGLSSLDGMNASENETGSHHDFKKDRWYRIRLRVTPENVSAWIDDKQVINAELKGREVSIHPAMEAACPLGLTNYTTKSAWRKISVVSIK